MKKIATVLTATAVVFLVSACKVSDEERAACEAAGNSVETDQFITQERGGFWSPAVESGDLYYCSTPQGHIMDVYNDEVTEVSHGLFGDSKDNVYVFEKCQEMEGVTYETKDGDSESTTTKFVCVQDGRVLTFEHRD